MFKKYVLCKSSDIIIFYKITIIQPFLFKLYFLDFITASLIRKVSCANVYEVNKMTNRNENILWTQRFIFSKY